MRLLVEKDFYRVPDSVINEEYKKEAREIDEMLIKLFERHNQFDIIEKELCTK